MSNRTVAVIGIVTFALLSVGIYLAWPSITSSTLLPPKGTPSPTPLNGTIVKTQNGFTLEATYVENNTWEYEISAQLPNPCTVVQTEVLVAESYPEQVTVRVITSSSAEMCAQVVVPYISTGTFSASERASVSLAVND